MTLAYYIAFGALLVALGLCAVLAISLGYLVLFGFSAKELRQTPLINRVHLPRHYWRHFFALLGTALVCAFVGCFAETIVQLVR